MTKFLHTTTNDDDYEAKAIAIPLVFSVNSQAKNFCCCLSEQYA